MGMVTVPARADGEETSKVTQAGPDLSCRARPAA
jgi:hypothetical protein